MSLRAVTLDAYGTLFDLDTVMLPAVESVVGELGLPLEPAALAATWTRRFHALHRSCALEGAPAFRSIREITEATLCESLVELGLPRTDTRDVVRGSEIWFERVASAPLYPEVRGAVALLASRFRLAVVSDTDDDYFLPCWKSRGLPVELVFTSYSTRSYKLSPDVLIFRHAFDALGVAPEEVIHVGDSVADIVGAAAAGARSVWLARHGEEWPHCTMPASNGPAPLQAASPTAAARSVLLPGPLDAGLVNERTVGVRGPEAALGLPVPAGPTFIARDLAEAADRIVALL